MKSRETSRKTSPLFAILTAGVIMVAGLGAIWSVRNSNYYKERLAELRPAAEQGDAVSQFDLGVMYANGKGVPQDYVEAVKWYRKAADQGLAEAQSNLGDMYANGQGVPQDHAEAVKMYRKIFDQGFDEGLALDAEAVEWCRKAADQGDAASQLNLGKMHANGQGIPQDDAEAVKWYRRAAEQGQAEAQALLGEMYYRGQGVPQNYVEAHKWYNLSAAGMSGPDREISTKGRDFVAARMTPEQIAEAQKRAREWKSNKE